MEFQSPSENLPRIPDDLTVAQFILDTEHELRPERPKGVPWMITDKSGRSVGLAELQSRTRSLSVSLRDEYSIGRNDVVLILSSNHIDYPVCIWAIHKLLGIVAPFNPSSTVSELVTHLRISKARLIISHEDSLSTANAAAQQVGIPAHRVIVLEDQDTLPASSPKAFKSKSVEQLIHNGNQSEQNVADLKLVSGEAKTQIAFYSPSSGTTGVPKIIQISHYAVLANVLQAVAVHKVGPTAPKYRSGDRLLGIIPFYHIYGIITNLHFNFFSAITLVVVPKYNFREMLRSIERYKINNLMLVPPQVILLCKDPIVKEYNLSHIRTILCGAAPLSDEVYDQLIQLVPQVNLVMAYGSTEATGVLSISPMNDQYGRHGGVLVPGVRARVVKDNGSLAAYDEEGELQVITPSVASGYLDNEEANAETFFSDGWMRTGDLVKINRKEEIIILDRIKEMIKVRGFQVAPAELEGCLLEHTYVRDACVVGVPHARSGEVPLAFVVPSDAVRHLPAEEFKRALHEHISVHKAPYKRIYQIEITDAIPKTPSGKLLRRELRERGRSLALGLAKL